MTAQLLFPKATYRPVPNHSGIMSEHRGLVLHSQEGYQSPYGWFSHPANQASSTFWVSKQGHVEQYGPANVIMWAQAAGNSTFNSIEEEGFTTEALTSAQLFSTADVYRWGVQEWGWPVQLSNNPTTHGFGWHGMGGQQWGGHFNCPGELRKSQRQMILNLVSIPIVIPADPNPRNAMQLAAPIVTVVSSTNGYWLIGADGGIFSFGDAAIFKPNLVNPSSPQHIVSATSTPDHTGLIVCGADGGIFTYGTAAFFGSIPGLGVSPA